MTLFNYKFWFIIVSLVIGVNLLSAVGYKSFLYSEGNHCLIKGLYINENAYPVEKLAAYCVNKYGSHVLPFFAKKNDITSWLIRTLAYGCDRNKRLEKRLFTIPIVKADFTGHDVIGTVAGGLMAMRGGTTGAWSKSNAVSRCLLGSVRFLGITKIIYPIVNKYLHRTTQAVVGKFGIVHEDTDTIMHTAAGIISHGIYDATVGFGVYKVFDGNKKKT